MMSPESLAAELDRDPFVPLRLHLKGERTLDILKPGLCFIARLGLYAFRGRPHEALAEDVQVVSLCHIVAVETLAASR